MIIEYFLKEINIPLPVSGDKITNFGLRPRNERQWPLENIFQALGIYPIIEPKENIAKIPYIPYQSRSK